MIINSGQFFVIINGTKDNCKVSILSIVDINFSTANTISEQFICD